MNELGAGDFLGEIALIDGGPRTATAIAAEPCRLLVLDVGRLPHARARSTRAVQGKIMQALAEPAARGAAPRRRLTVI